MLIQGSKPETLMQQLYGSMSRQLRSNNPVLRPAVCSITHEEIADLKESHLSLIVVGIQNRLKSDGHKVDVRYVMTPDEPHACLIVGTVPA